MSKSDPDVPDLRALLTEASRPSASCTVPLKQGLREEIARLEDELRLAAEGELTTDRRMSSRSPVKVLAEQIEAKRAEMRASELTFHFEALTAAERESIRQAMAGRDDLDELDLRATSTMCRKVTGPDGTEYPQRMAWTDFRDLREAVGAYVYDQTIDTAASRAGGGDWSVPFSSAASLILETGESPSR